MSGLALTTVNAGSLDGVTGGEGAPECAKKQRGDCCRYEAGTQTPLSGSEESKRMHARLNAFELSLRSHKPTASISLEGFRRQTDPLRLSLTLLYLC